MHFKKIKRTLRKLENASTILHEYFYNTLEEENIYEQVVTYLGVDKYDFKTRLTSNRITILEFIHLVDFFNNRIYEKN